MSNPSRAAVSLLLPVAQQLHWLQSLALCNPVAACHGVQRSPTATPCSLAHASASTCELHGRGLQPRRQQRSSQWTRGILKLVQSWIKLSPAPVVSDRGAVHNQVDNQGAQAGADASAVSIPEQRRRPPPGGLGARRMR